jgi:hypothetical protein
MHEYTNHKWNCRTFIIKNSPGVQVLSKNLLGICHISYNQTEKLCANMNPCHQFPSQVQALFITSDHAQLKKFSMTHASLAINTKPPSWVQPVHSYTVSCDIGERHVPHQLSCGFPSHHSFNAGRYSHWF